MRAVDLSDVYWSLQAVLEFCVWQWNEMSRYRRMPWCGCECRYWRGSKSPKTK